MLALEISSLLELVNCLAGSGPDMAALWASLPLPQSLGGSVHPSLPPQAASDVSNCTRPSPFATRMLAKAQQVPSEQRQ